MFNYLLLNRSFIRLGKGALRKENEFLPCIILTYSTLLYIDTFRNGFFSVLEIKIKVTHNKKSKTHKLNEKMSVLPLVI